MRLHSVSEGPANGPVVVLSSSLGSDLRVWDHQAKALVRAGYRVVRYDHRGHGGSPAPEGPYTLAELATDVVELLDAYEVCRAHFVGLSLGGMVGMWLAATAPERVDRLVLCCTSITPGTKEAWARRAGTVRREGIAAVVDEVLSRWFTSPADDFWREMFVGTSAGGYASCCAAIEGVDVAAELPKITAPTLVIAGEHDRATPPEDGLRIATGIPNSRLAVVPGSAHLGPAERAPEFTELILDHLGGSRRTAGEAVRREVLGDAHVDAAEPSAFQTYITEAVWGSIWTRPGLDRRTRSCITLAILTALRCHDELALHVRAALRNGLTAEEIDEVILHTGAYAGVPAANSAFLVARGVARSD
ncbi:bifunctional 3-oxoadipate enol-lactonase/4-carboxymuconolactone decarboxylase PcaDC [Allokutzneria albata]|uniref:3-oxoadipate enol-lactonase / 4-carboxymuconolactone decarboxylase n=1 Tax=Allokutzneria albata TaxID=211114 RepID=A0A1H0DCS4_ALLAB|nr:3-oxoadipate enol-lactonase / 4-carboxymuconolactone decarboxylase [Allokutzneria albata]